MATFPKRVSGGGAGYDAWGIFEIDLISISDPRLIDWILHNPNTFEYIEVSVDGTSGWLVDPTAEWHQWLFPTTYPIFYKRVSVYDGDMSG